MIDKLAAHVARQEGWYNADPTVVPRRLNNPGDLDFAGQMGATPVKVGGHNFAKWPTPQQGIVGLYRQLLADIAQGWSLRKIIYSWAPPSENDTAIYLAHVAADLGVDVDAPLWNYLTLLP